jgi:restriction system protein
MDLYEDDEDLSNWIDLALARYPIREVILGSEASFAPRRNDGLDFERSVAQTLEEAGFHVEATPSSGDQGADVIATSNGLRFAIQCKDYAGQVGNAAVQEVLAAKAFYRADYAVVCSNGGYTKSAKALAATSNVLLITPELLSDLDKIRMLVE